MKNKEARNLAARYFVLVVLGLFNLWLFYLIFSPLTVYPVFGILKIIDSGANLFLGNMIFFSGEYIEIVEACVAGAAYYLLLIFNLATPMEWKKRTKSIAFLIIGFLVLNILRILIFTALFVAGYKYFDVAHILTWHFGSTVLIVLLWFVNVWLFRIKEIPVYSDVKNLYRDIAKRKEK